MDRMLVLVTCFVQTMQNRLTEESDQIFVCNKDRSREASRDQAIYAKPTMAEQAQVRISSQKRRRSIEPEMMMQRVEFRFLATFPLPICSSCSPQNARLQPESPRDAGAACGRSIEPGHRRRPANSPLHDVQVPQRT